MRKPLLILGLVGLLTTALVVPAAAAKPANPGADNRPTLLSTAIDLNASGPYAGQFDTLIALAGRYDAVIQALSGTTQLTVFAPTDGAFDALFAFAAENGLVLTDEMVLDVLLYHVAPGRWSADRIVDNDGGRLPTLNGDSLEVSIGGGVFIDQAQVIAADITTSNGFIHAVSSVLLPGS